MYSGGTPLVCVSNSGCVEGRFAPHGLAVIVVGVLCELKLLVLQTRSWHGFVGCRLLYVMTASPVRRRYGPLLQQYRERVEVAEEVQPWPAVKAGPAEE